MTVGMDPVSALDDRSRYDNAAIEPSVVGIVPEKELLEKSNSL